MNTIRPWSSPAHQLAMLDLDIAAGRAHLATLAAPMAVARCRGELYQLEADRAALAATAGAVIERARVASGQSTPVACAIL